MAVRLWKTNLVLEDLARQIRRKMWPKWGISWGLIDVWQSEWSVVCWLRIAKPSTKFCSSNWACRKFVPSWSQKFSPMNRRKTEGMCAWTFLNASEMTKIFFKHVITGDETWILEYDPDAKRQSSEWHTSNSPRPKTHKKVSSCQARDYGHLDAASRQCSLSHCHLRERIFGQKVFQCSRSHHTSLIWVRVISSFSQNSNSTSKVVILELWTTSKRSWQNSWGHFHMKTSSAATGSGSNVSGGVWLPKGTTLKGIRLIYR